MALIKIIYDGLDQQATTIGNLIDQYNSLNARATNMRNQIASTWQGQAANAYSEKLGAYISEANKMVDVLEAFKSYANNSSVRFRELDHNCGSAIRNSF